MTIAELKRALVEVHTWCHNRARCSGCPFDNEKSSLCPIMGRPDQWDVYDWKEEAQDDA